MIWFWSFNLKAHILSCNNTDLLQSKAKVLPVLLWRSKIYSNIYEKLGVVGEEWIERKIMLKQTYYIVVIKKILRKRNCEKH